MKETLQQTIYCECKLTQNINNHFFQVTLSSFSALKKTEQFKKRNFKKSMLKKQEDFCVKNLHKATIYTKKDNSMLSLD